MELSNFLLDIGMMFSFTHLRFGWKGRASGRLALSNADYGLRFVSPVGWISHFIIIW